MTARSVAIIQARMSSSRLPGKVLMDLGGMPAMAWTCRAARSIPGLDEVVVATSTDPSDDPIVAWCERASIGCYRGSLGDVLDRYILAARTEAAEVVMRLTADCPFLDPQVCGELLRLLFETNADYACNFDPPGWPHGIDCEVFSSESLETAWREGADPFYREHVTPFIRENRHRFRIENLTCPMPDMTRHRWTLDYPADLEYLRQISDLLGPTERPPCWLDIVRLLESHPEIRNRTSEENDKRAVPVLLAKDITRPEQSPPLSRTIARRLPLRAAGQAADTTTVFVGGHEAYVWDANGTRYVDLGVGLHSAPLGYRDPAVDAAIRRQLCEGTSDLLVPYVEAGLSEEVAEAVPYTEACVFSSDPGALMRTALAVAREETGRSVVARLGGPDGLACQGALQFDNIEVAESGIAPTELAALVVEPSTLPDDGGATLSRARALAERGGGVLMLDETLTGLRFAASGSFERSRVAPDLAVFGSSLANGLPMGALLGRAALLRRAAGFGAAALPPTGPVALAAARATLGKFQRNRVAARLWENGESLHRDLSRLIENHELAGAIALVGQAPRFAARYSPAFSCPAAMVKNAVNFSLRRFGVLVDRIHAVCFPMGPQQLGLIAAAYDETFRTLREALASGTPREPFRFLAYWTAAQDP